MASTPTASQAIKKFTIDALIIKERVRERDGYACVECGISQAEYMAIAGRRLDVHRKIPGGEYSLENCETLCRKCHGPKPRSKYGEAAKQGKISIRLRPDLGIAFESFIESQPIRVSKKAVIEAALKFYLASKGFWPPKR